MSRAIFVCLLLLNIIACRQPSGKDSESRVFTVVATTGMIKDAAANIAGDRAEVIALMGPGVDPHLYKATQGDLRRLTRADVILYNGLHLEGKMGEVFEKLANSKPVFPVAENAAPEALIQTAGFQGTYDPHLWFDVSLWAKVVSYISEILQEQDPTNASFYKDNAASYIEELNQLHAEVRDSIASIPKEQRVLITAHDAFGYFGRAYDIEVRGLQGISTLSEYGIKDVTDLVNFIVDKKIKAVFVESSVPEKALQAVVEGAQKKGQSVSIGGTLYSDAMGAEDSPEGTYTGMVRANVQTIVGALK